MQVVFQVLCSRIYSGVYMCECTCRVSSHGDEESDDLEEEIVSQFDHEGPNASVPSAGWQEGEELVSGVCGVACNRGGFPNTASGVYVCDRGEKDSDDIFSCPHYLLQGLAICDGVIPKPGSDAGAQNALYSLSVKCGEDGGCFLQSA